MLINFRLNIWKISLRKYLVKNNPLLVERNCKNLHEITQNIMKRPQFFPVFFLADLNENKKPGHLTRFLRLKSRKRVYKAPSS
jgi:hypothetical protein